MGAYPNYFYFTYYRIRNYLFSTEPEKWLLEQSRNHVIEPLLCEKRKFIKLFRFVLMSEKQFSSGVTCV